MKDTSNPLVEGLDRFSALLGWWGAPGLGGGFEGHMNRMLQFGAELQKLCAAAYDGQIETLMTVNDRLASGLQALLHSRNPQDLATAEAEIVGAMLAGASLQAQRWIGLSQKLQDCSAAIACATEADARPGASDVSAVPVSAVPASAVPPGTAAAPARR
ncbi:MAG: hypothetical protein KGL52_10350 [Rhodospirillales bacterium]|jgi:hypothetical protein|nr:hypothetical protein [Rhodospirillales bacterium]